MYLCVDAQQPAATTSITSVTGVSLKPNGSYKDDADDVSVDAMGWDGMGQGKVGQDEDEWLLLYYHSQGRHIDKHLTIADHLCCIK